MPRFKNVDGVDIQFTAAEETAKDAEEKIYTDARPAREMEEIRRHRNGLLAETDWRATSDLIMSDAWKTYRQELRDIPATNTLYSHADGTSAVTWPTKPE